ncbi:MAG: DoxX family protein [Chitinophagaceae bacterium]|nr:DoxX family protein [Chitinophagaceae bacterium]
MSFFNIANGEPGNWSKREKITLRFFIIFFVVQVIPFDGAYFFSGWSASSFYNFFRLTRYYPQWFGIEGFGNWAIAAVLALAGTIVWTYREKKPVNYDVLYYWLRVILRYRLAIAVIAYGVIKLFPLQMPYPSLSNLHTNYGDFYGWKIYFHTLGITQGYESFLGAVEVAAGILLLFRKTTTFGAGIIIGFTGNVFAANIAYHIGEEAYAAFLLSIALFLFAYDAPRLYRLLVEGRFTYANRFRPVFSDKTIDVTRKALKSAFVLFIIAFSAGTYANFVSGPYKYPTTPGLSKAYGLYNVREFKFNNKLIPYSLTDTNRWHNVIFEKWATLSIKTAKPIQVDNSTGDEFFTDDNDRNFESAGVAGRRYFSYTIDSTNQTVRLKNKNRHHASESFALTYSFPNDSTIVLSGTNENKDSVYAVLDKINKKYMLQEGRRKRVKL